MNEIRIIAVGSVKEDFYRAKISFFLNEIKKYCKSELIELKDESIPANAGDAIMQEIKNKEGERILEHISNGDYVVALCIEGIPTDTTKLKGLIEKAKERYVGAIVFVIGGSLGLCDRVVRRADYKLSFSRMTFPHQLMRVMLLEQVNFCVCP